MSESPTTNHVSANRPLTLCIVGLGLMGASLALAVRGRYQHIAGVTRREEVAREALARGIVDSASTSLQQGVAQADLIVLATPVRTIIDQLHALAGSAPDNAIITDLGSTKSEIIQAMNQLPPRLRAVGSHPMCGKEVTGLDAADADLYRGKTWIVTRSARSDDAALTVVQTLAEDAGAVPLELEPAQHDMLVAFASHLPYALAVALVTTADQASLNDPALWRVTASGFRDTSRVAASDVTMMLDILMTNAPAVTGAIRDFQFALDQLTALIERKDEAGLRAYLAAAAQTRKAHF
ncbi:MAG: prephenate dehydrogenase [Anaerolineae bacterium]|nr:prephenate dehydrogenase [Thermoflexales bacterium]MDW8406175.1 prephenate dehydrogenase [Anaerolineae bacterium]